jgi:hypothetical protein
MTTPLFSSAARWIWTDSRKLRPFNNFVAFRRVVAARDFARDAALRITADARYELYVNGRWIGHGPARSWPSPWPVDTYDLRGELRAGENVIAVLVQDIGIETFQYVLGRPGLLAQLDWKDADGAQRVVTDGAWRAEVNEAFAWPVPRISVQQAWEEQYDARDPVCGDGRWRGAGYDDRDWPWAVEMRPAGAAPHEALEPRDIPALTREVVAPVRVLAAEAVSVARQTWSFHPRRAFNPNDLRADIFRGRLLAATYIHSPCAQPVQLLALRANWGKWEWKLNGAPLAFDDLTLQKTDSGVAHARLKEGWNVLMLRYPTRTHGLTGTVSLWSPKPVEFASGPEARPGTYPWLVIGPFPDGPDRADPISPVIIPAPLHPEATMERHDAIWARGELTAADRETPFVRPMTRDMVMPVDVFALAATERVLPGRTVRVDEPQALLHDGPEWAVIHPPKEGDARILLDFGDEVVGYHEFELDAGPGGAGTVLDVHNFEFIQRDGLINLAEGMNNTFRYTCRPGCQRYRTFVRRGFRYSWISVRNQRAPLRLRAVRMINNTYPVLRQGDFRCSDPVIERIWHVGARSVRACSEDTYTDCPTYEQTLWVGDARNEALVDLVANGDPRLSRRCWMLSARSLERSPLVECHVPSGWKAILPAWTFLWMRWAEEHFRLTGDRETALEMLDWLDRNARGIEQRLDRRGLFVIKAWNMFDWAPMATPTDGIVTHQNCLAVLGLRQTSGLARALGRPALARRWEALAGRISRAVNTHLWDPRKRAYLDALMADGKPSPVFSQQTHTAAYISGVAQGDRARRCRAIISKAPRGFVTAGSPFFMFFLLEALEREGRFTELLDTVRNYWGPQIEEGATTFYEMYHPKARRKTRSHCHGWSAAPTYFLSQHALGVQPLTPGYGTVRVAPRPGRMTWAQGRVPTPRGVVEVRWVREKGRFTLDLVLPPDTPARIELPAAGKVAVVAPARAAVRKLRSPGGESHFSVKGGKVTIRVGP